MHVLLSLILVLASLSFVDDAVGAERFDFCNSLLFDVSGEQKAALSSQVIGILPGSFNPLHEGHVELARVAEKILGGKVAYELSIGNADKGLIYSEDVLARVRQFTHHAAVVVTGASLFIEKARLFPGKTFVIGVDTADRLHQLKYYGGSAATRAEVFEEFRRLGTRFLVGARTTGKVTKELKNCAIPAEFADLFQPIPLALYNSSSSSTQYRDHGSAPEPWSGSIHQLEALYVKQGLTHVFDSEILSALPQISNLGDHLRGYFGADSSELKLVSPQTSTQNDSEVSIVQLHGRRVAVVKLFLSSSQEFFREVIALRSLKRASLSELRPVEIFDIAKIERGGKLHPVLLMESASGVELEALARELRTRTQPLEKLSAGVKKVALALSELHSRFEAQEESEETVSRYKDYEVAQATKLSAVFEKMARLGLISEAESAFARARVHKLAQGFASQLKRRSRIIGDAHLANFFFDPEKGALTAIDTEKHAYSLEDAIDPVADVARFWVSLEMGAKRDFSADPSIELLQNEFLKAYLEASVSRSAVADLSSFRYHQARYYLVILNSLSMREQLENRKASIARILSVLRDPTP